jgi:hypothetical protein
MGTNKDRFPHLPYLSHPGRCPRCGVTLCPEAHTVIVGGSWSKGGPRGEPVTAGHVFECQCPRCELRLLSFPDGWPRWEDMDPSQVLWCPKETEDLYGV